MFTVSGTNPREVSSYEASLNQSSLTLFLTHDRGLCHCHIRVDQGTKSQVASEQLVVVRPTLYPCCNQAGHMLHGAYHMVDHQP